MTNTPEVLRPGSKCVAARAFTLMEMLTAITLSTLVIGGVGLLLVGAWRLERMATDHRALQDNLDRLSDRFRRDVHSAFTIDSLPTADEAPASRLILRMGDDKRIEYELTEAGISRLAYAGDAVSHRDVFRLATGLTGGWKADGSGERRTVMLTLNYPLGTKMPEYSGRRELRVDAVVGLHPPEVALRRATP